MTTDRATAAPPGDSTGEARSQRAPPVAANEALVVESSPAQREIFAASMLSTDASRGYNTTLSLLIDDPLDTAGLARAVVALGRRHDVLRGHFSPDGLTFRIPRGADLELAVADLTGLPVADRHARYQAYLRGEGERLFDLVHGPLVRLQLFRLAEREWALVVSGHDAAVDDWSFRAIVSDLGRLYATVTGVAPEDLAPATPFATYLRGIAADAMARAEADLEYWRATYRDGVPVLDLPTDHPRPPLRSYASAQHERLVDPGLGRRFLRAAASAGLPPRDAMLAVVAAYFGRFADQSDFALGVLVAGQTLGQQHDAIGHDTRLVPLRCASAEGDSFLSFARRLSLRLDESLQHAHLSLPQLLTGLAIPVDRSRVPFVPVTFGFDRRTERPDGRVPGLNARLATHPRVADTFELGIHVVLAGEDLTLQCSFNTTLFAPSEMGRRLGQIETLMASVSDDPEQPLAACGILPDGQARELDEQLNGRAATPPTPRRIEDLIAHWVRERPDHVAVEDRDRTQTFRALWSCSAAIAAALRAAHVGRGTVVGIALERSHLLPAALLGVWRAGGAFLPLDRGLPAARIAQMTARAGARVLLSDAPLPTGWGPADLVPVDLRRAMATDPVPETANAAGDPGDAAYVIFTSGSTGEPKGVRVSHGALHHLLESLRDGAPGFTSNDRLVAVTPLSFDIAELELWLPLVSGGTVAIVDRDTAADGHALGAFVEAAQATWMQATPATWRLLLLSGWRGRPQLTALCGGEALPPDLADDLRPRVGALWNAYGPTETTVWSTIERVGPGPISIGRPIGGTLAYVLDRRRRWVPRGAVGELWIGGPGVADGYVGRDDLTAERFFPNGMTGSGRLYRTGDLVRLRLDGRLEFVGRTDNQVKVRGFRIELDEVQRALARHPSIRECAVAIRKGATADVQLVAYFAVEGGARIGAAELRSTLATQLPEYMVPSAFVEVPRLPLTPNGKIDLRALPDPSAVAAAANGELALLESALRPLPHLRDCAAVYPPGRDPDTRPVLFVVTDGTDPPSAVDLRRRLVGRVPESLMPELVLPMDALPRSAGAEIDRRQLLRALPAAAAGDVSARPGDGPETWTAGERLLGALWKELLEVDHVGRRDNFFSLGGHSLLAIRMIAATEQRCGVRLSPRNVLLDTFAQLAAVIDAAGPSP